MYIGMVKDRLRTLPQRKTRKYKTYKEAHEHAEKLCRKYGERGSVTVYQV